MAQELYRPRDDGKLRMPRVDGAMQKIAPRFAVHDGRGDNMMGYPEGDDGHQEKVLDTMRKRMEKAISAESDNRKAGLDDRLFKAGNQWPTEVMAQRNLDKRPCLTVNKLPTFVHQIVNDQRQNRPGINISPVGDRGDPEVARMYRGLIRYIERDCAADIAYDTAFDDAVTMGWGYWRVLTEWEASDSFHQVIVVRRIRNPFTVYMDPASQDPTGADAKWAFVTEWVPRDEFKATYPDAVEVPYSDGGIGEKMNSWASKDAIRIAEYFEIKEEKRTLVKLSNGHVGWKDELDDITKARIKTKKLEIEDERESLVPTVMWYKATAVTILKEEEWAGSSIPIVKVVGDEIDIEGAVKLSGVIRFAKDPQRMVNYWSTALTEIVALQPKAPWVMEEGQAEGHEDEWKNANVKNQPVLFYKGTNVGGTPAPPPQRQPMAGVPTGIQQALQNSAQDMMATTGVRFDATLNERMIDESGRALRELRRAGDIGAFHYVDNLARSLRRTGEIIVELIPKIYVDKQVVTILREDDKEEQVTIDPNLGKASGEERKPDGKMRKMFNPNFGKYGVTVTIGPSYATKRIEASENMMAFMRALPQTAALVADLFCAEQDWPGAEKIAARLAKTVPPNLMSPDPKDIPPQVAAIMQGMEGQIKQLTQQLQAAMAAIQDEGQDRAIDMKRIQNEYEIKLLGIISNTETKMAAIAQKSHDNAASNTRAMFDHIQDLGKGVNELTKVLSKEPANDEGEPKTPAHGTAEEPLPPEAMAHLRPGRATRFANGQSWTVDESGKPKRHA